MCMCVCVCIKIEGNLNMDWMSNDSGCGTGVKIMQSSLILRNAY